MVNLSSRPFSLTINGTNYTSKLLETKLNDSPWDESGEIATMLECQIWGALDEVDPLVNADLKHGAEVVLQIANDAGTILAGRDRTLYIIRLAFNEETHVCSFTACDKLTWNNWDEELDDQDIEDLLIDQNAFDDGIQHAELARLFLQEKGLSASISGTFPDYRINYMVSPDTWVSGAREIVASALGYIWVAPSGAIEIRPINTAASPAFHLSLSQCDSDRASQEVTPAEKVIAVCNQPITSRNEPETPNTWSGNTVSQQPDEPDTEAETEVTYRYVRIEGTLGQNQPTGGGGYGGGGYEWVETPIVMEYFLYSTIPSDTYVLNSIIKVSGFDNEVREIDFYRVDLTINGTAKSVWAGDKVGPAEYPFGFTNVRTESPWDGVILLSIMANENRSGILSELSFNLLTDAWDNYRIAKLLVDGVSV